MIHHAWSVLCKSTTVDQTSHMVSLFNAVTEIKVQTMVPVPPGVIIPLAFNLELFSSFYRESSDGPAQAPIQITVTDGTGEALAPPGEAVIAFNPGVRMGGAKTVIGIVNGRAPGGMYFCDVALRQSDKEQWERVAHVPVEVIFEPPFFVLPIPAQ